MDEKNNTADENMTEDEISVEKENDVMTEEKLREQYEQLPAWKHVLLVIICLFAMVSVFMLIDFVVDFLVELAKHIF